MVVQFLLKVLQVDLLVKVLVVYSLANTIVRMLQLINTDCLYITKVTLTHNFLLDFSLTPVMLLGLCVGTIIA